MPPRLYPWFLPFAVAALIALGCGEDAAKPQAPKVTVEKPVQKPVTDYLEITGTIKSVQQVEIRARVEGFLDSIEFEEGEQVEAGQLLYRIDPSEYETQVARAKASVETAKAALALAEATLKRRESALKTGAVSELEVLENRAERDVRVANLQSAQAELRHANLDLGYTRILTPVTGRAGDSQVDPGNLVGAGEQTLLTKIVQYDPIYAYFSISERELLRLVGNRDVAKDEEERVSIARGVAVEVARSTDDGFPFKGKLDFADQAVDEKTGTFMLRAVFDNPNPVHLIPGLFVRGRIPLRQRQNALLVSERALGSDQSGRFVLTVDDENIAQYKPVKIGALVDGMRVIEDGITAEDRVITKGVLYARPGSPVTPESDGPTAPADTMPSGD